MKDYKYYSTEDFVQDMRFRFWVRSPSAEEDLFWENWIKDNEERRGIIEEARAIVLAIHPVHGDNISDLEIKNEIQDILARINEDEKNSPKQESSWSSWVKVAASISVLLVAGWYGIPYAYKGNEAALNKSVVAAENYIAENYIIERVNKSMDTLLINLPDNSSVLLSQNSLIRYPREFTDDTRKVFLEGTAFFEVTKDLHKPFYVNAGKIVAKVLGTSFEISTDPVDEEIRVIVKSGTVSIYSNSEADQKKPDYQPKIILTQNEQLILKDDMSEMQHTRLDSFSIEELKVPDTYLKFKGTPAAEVFKSLTKVYGVSINFEDAQIGDCSVTATFTDEPFSLKLDLICRSIGLAYEMINDHVIITGNGCKN